MLSLPADKASSGMKFIAVRAIKVRQQNPMIVLTVDNHRLGKSII